MADLVHTRGVSRLALPTLEGAVWGGGVLSQRLDVLLAKDG